MEPAMLPALLFLFITALCFWYLVPKLDTRIKDQQRQLDDLKRELEKMKGKG